MSNPSAEINPSLGLGGLLLGQSSERLRFELYWDEGQGIRRGYLEGSSIQVVMDHHTIIGLIAESGYTGKLPAGAGPGDTVERLLQAYPDLRSNDLDGSLYEPDRLGFVVHLDEGRVESVVICDWNHDYWTYARPLLSEADLDKDEDEP